MQHVDSICKKTIHSFFCGAFPLSIRQLSLEGGPQGPKIPTRIVMSSQKFEEWFASKRISEVECLVADMSGTARGKILPPSKFLKGSRSNGLRIPEEVFTL